MKNPDFRRMYAKLSADERFRLILIMRSQGKNDEVQRIVNSYDSKDYILFDRGVYRRHEAITMIVDDFYLLWLIIDRYRQTKKADSIMDILHDTHNTGKIPEISLLLAEMKKDVLWRDCLKGMIDSFDSFCSDNGFEADYILTFCGFYHQLKPEFELYRKYDKTELSGQFGKEYKEKLTQAWETVCSM